MTEMRLRDSAGKRLYLTAQEREGYLRACASFDPEQCAFAEMLAYTGCRISEALELTPGSIDLDAGVVVFRSLKKRRQDVYRAIPVPPAYMDSLQRTFSLRQAQKRRGGANKPIWPWHRQHGWRIVKEVMEAADITPGPHRCPKGLRHAYGVHAIRSGVPVTQLQKWLGHADLSTTAIYVDLVGEEASDVAARMWA